MMTILEAIGLASAFIFTGLGVGLLLLAAHHWMMRETINHMVTAITDRLLPKAMEETKQMSMDMVVEINKKILEMAKGEETY